MSVIILSALLGAVLGLRFKALVLLPATIVCCGIVITPLVLHNSSTWAMIVAVVQCQIGLQLGYIAATVAHYFSEQPINLR